LSRRKLPDGGAEKLKRKRPKKRERRQSQTPKSSEPKAAEAKSRSSVEPETKSRKEYPSDSDYTCTDEYTYGWVGFSGR